MTLKNFYHHCKINRQALLTGAGGFAAALLLIVYPAHLTVASAAGAALQPATQVARLDSAAARQLAELHDDVDRLRAQLSKQEQAILQSTERVNKSETSGLKV